MLFVSQGGLVEVALCCHGLKRQKLLITFLQRDVEILTQGKYIQSYYFLLHIVSDRLFIKFEVGTYDQLSPRRCAGLVRGCTSY